jgi:hypothetical protein
MDVTQNLLLPFDSYCPSLQSKIHARICSICKQYIPSAMRLRNHYRVHQQRYASNSIEYNNKKEEEEIIEECEPIDLNELSVFKINPSHNGVFLFSNMIEWLKSDFEDDPIIEPKQKSSATIANAMIRKEKQLQEAAAAAIGISPASMAQMTTIVESVATISVDNALTLINETEIKIENDPISIVDVRTENDDVLNAMEQLIVNDNEANSCDDVQIDNSLNQYDDLSDLIDKI